MDLRQLRILTKVAQTGSFTAAAEELFMTQSAVSQQMARLEREVRQPVFERGARGVELTAAGREVAEHAARVLAEMDRFEHAVDGLGGEEAPLRVGTFSSAGAELLPRAIQRYRSLIPDAGISMRRMNPRNPVDALVSDSVDLLLAFDYTIDPKDFGTRVERLHLLDDPFHVLLPVGHRLAHAAEVDLADLADEEWIFRRHSPPHEDVYERACLVAGFSPDVVFTADDLRMLQGLVAVGIGIGLAPLSALSPARDDVVTVPVTRPAVSRRVSVLTMPTAGPDARVAAFLDALVREADPSGEQAP